MVYAGTYRSVILTLKKRLKQELVTEFPKFKTHFLQEIKVQFFHLGLHRTPSNCTRVCFLKIFAFVASIRILIHQLCKKMPIFFEKTRLPITLCFNLC